MEYFQKNILALENLLTQRPRLLPTLVKPLQCTLIRQRVYLISMNKRIIVAIDSFDADHAFSIINKLDSKLCMLKIGSVAFNSIGRDLIDYAFKQGFDIFLDLKLHDIPNTVKKTIQGLKSLPIKMLTIHSSGGVQMMKAAVEGAKDSGIKVFGVTALTSLSDADSMSIFQRNAASQVDATLDLAQEACIDGVVCSPHEPG